MQFLNRRQLPDKTEMAIAHLFGAVQEGFQGEAGQGAADADPFPPPRFPPVSARSARVRAGSAMPITTPSPPHHLVERLADG